MVIDTCGRQVHNRAVPWMYNSCQRHRVDLTANCSSQLEPTSRDHILRIWHTRQRAAIEDSRLRPRAQRTVRIHSQTSLYIRRGLITAERCERQRRARGVELKRWSSALLCVASLGMTSLGHKPRRTQHVLYYVKHDFIHKTGSTQCVALLLEKHWSMATDNMYRKFRIVCTRGFWGMMPLRVDRNHNANLNFAKLVIMSTIANLTR